MDLTAAFQSVCFLKVRKIFLKKIVMGFLFLWVSSEVSHVWYSVLLTISDYNTCSLFTVPLFSLQSSLKNKNRGEFIDRQRKGARVALEEENRWSLFFFLTLCACSCMLAVVFRKNEKKK